MASAGDQINRALRLLGVLAEGETPSAAVSTDALTALNQMIDSWNTERCQCTPRKIKCLLGLLVKLPELLGLLVIL